MRSLTSRVKTDAVGTSLPPGINAELPPVKFDDFSGGFFRGAKNVKVPRNAAADTLDTEVTRDNKLRRAPGTTQVEAFAGRTVTQLILHPTLDFTSELLAIAGAELGVKSAGATVWSNVGLPLGAGWFHHALYGDDLLFSNGRDSIFVRHPHDASVTKASVLPLGSTMAVIAGRLFIGGASFDGNFEPMGQFWTGADNFDDVDELNGSGSELLIADTGISDAIVANRVLGLDIMAILCRRSVWIGRVTGDAGRPLDFQLRFASKGCVSEPTAITVHGGVVYLGDEGVEMFDGNYPTNVSEAINAEILPLDYAHIGQYSASYDWFRRWYYLYTPTATYIYDLRFSRWYKRSLIAASGTMFAQQFPGLTYGQAVGTYGSQTLTYADMSPPEAGLADQVFLGFIPGQSYSLDKEDYASTKNFGVDQNSFWKTLVDEAAQKSNKAWTVKATRVEYEGAGILELLINGGVSLGNYNLVQADEPEVVQMKCNQTARALQMELRFHTGEPIVSQFEEDVIPRSSLRKLDARRHNKAAFIADATELALDVGTLSNVGFPGTNDTVEDDINVDDATVNGVYDVIKETDAAVYVDLPGFGEFGGFAVGVDGEPIFDTALTFGPLLTYDPVEDTFVVDDSSSLPAIAVAGVDSSEVTIEIGV